MPRARRPRTSPNPWTPTILAADRTVLEAYTRLLDGERTPAHPGEAPPTEPLSSAPLTVEDLYRVTAAEPVSVGSPMFWETPPAPPSMYYTVFADPVDPGISFTPLEEGPTAIPATDQRCAGCGRHYGPSLWSRCPDCRRATRAASVQSPEEPGPTATRQSSTNERVRQCAGCGYFNDGRDRCYNCGGLFARTMTGTTRPSTTPAVPILEIVDRLCGKYFVYSDRSLRRSRKPSAERLPPRAEFYGLVERHGGDAFGYSTCVDPTSVPTITAALKGEDGEPRYTISSCGVEHLEHRRAGVIRVRHLGAK